MIVNIALAASLMYPLQHVGIAIATSVSSWVNALALGAVLWQRGFLQADERLKRRLPRILAATALMAGGLYALQAYLEPWFRGAPIGRAVALVVLIAVGLGIYGLACLVLGAARPSDLKAALRRKA